MRRWRRRPRLLARSLARSAARGPPGRAHCSRPVSTGLARRWKPFPWSASAPPSAYGCRGPHGRLRSDTRTSPRASPRDREFLAVGAGLDAWGRRPSCFGTRDRGGPGTLSRPHIPGEPLPAPEYLLQPLRAVGSPPRWRWGRGRLGLFWQLRVLNPGRLCPNP